MNSKEQSWQFLVLSCTSILLLVVVTVFALRSDVSREAAVAALLIDIALQIAFGMACLWALRSNSRLQSLPRFVDHGSPSLTSLAAIAPWLVLLQIGMGAALRYKLMGAISHVIGAMLVGAFLLYLASGVMAPAPPGHPARIASVTLLWVVLAQVLLGIAAYVVRFGQGTDSGLPDTRLFSIAHIITGALTLAATYVLCYLIQKCSTKQEAAGLPSTGTV